MQFNAKGIIIMLVLVVFIGFVVWMQRRGRPGQKPAVGPAKPLGPRQDGDEDLDT